MPLDHENLVLWDTNWSRPDVEAVSLYQSGVSSTCPLQLFFCHSITFVAPRMPPGVKIILSSSWDGESSSPSFFHYADLNHFLPLLCLCVCFLFHPGSWVLIWLFTMSTERAINLIKGSWCWDQTNSCPGRAVVTGHWKIWKPEPSNDHWSERKLI